MSGEFTGYIDLFTETEVSGWVLQPRPGASFPVPVLRVNGKDVANMRLTGERPDVIAAFGRDAIGIYAKLARHLANGRNIVEIVFVETGAMLTNGRRAIALDRDRVAGEYWSRAYSDHSNLIIRWWQHDYIVRAVNQRICGDDVPGLSHGLYRVVKDHFPLLLPARRGVSVGGGYGLKEMEAIDEGLVSHFDLYEVSKIAVDRGRRLARERDLETQITFHLADAFAEVTGSDAYDLVFWNNALHHMPSTREAIEWSRQVLKRGGLLVMDEYVGATRMQFPDEMLRISSDYRNTLPQEYLASPYDPLQTLERECVRPDEDDLIAMDPSECADSANILPALLEVFPGVEVKPTGGGVYHLGLSDVLHNISEAGDTAALVRAMEFDDLCLSLGLTQYAVAYGVNRKAP